MHKQFNVTSRSMELDANTCPANGFPPKKMQRRTVQGITTNVLVVVFVFFVMPGLSAQYIRQKEDGRLAQAIRQSLDWRPRNLRRN